MKISAVVDRIVGELAVLLLGDEEEEVAFPLAFLPPLKEGACLEIVIQEHKSLEEERRRQAEVLLKRLTKS